jgi:hypothetical protein
MAVTSDHEFSKPGTIAPAGRVLSARLRGGVALLPHGLQDGGMASKQTITVVVTDDVDGSVLETAEAVSITFGVDGTAYEIDLSPGNAASLRNDFGMWMDHARKVSTRPAASARMVPRSTASPDQSQSAAIREWAATVVAAFNAAH